MTTLDLSALALAFAAAMFCLMMFACFMGNRAFFRMIHRTNEGKHWSQQEPTFKLELNRFERILKEYRAVEPDAPLIREFWKYAAILFLAWAGLAAVMVFWSFTNPQ